VGRNRANARHLVAIPDHPLPGLALNQKMDADHDHDLAAPNIVDLGPARAVDASQDLPLPTRLIKRRNK